MRLLHLTTAVPSHKYTTEEEIELFPCELQEEVRHSILNLGVSTRYFANPVDFSLKLELKPNNEEPLGISALAPVTRL